VDGYDKVSSESESNVVAVSFTTDFAQVGNPTTPILILR